MIPYSINKTSLSICMHYAPTRGEKRTKVETLHACTLQSLSWSNRRLSSPGTDSSASILTCHSRKKRKAAKQGRRLSSIRYSSNVEPVNTAAASPPNGMQQPSIHLQPSRHDMSAWPLRIRSISTAMMKRSSTVAPLLWLHDWLMRAALDVSCLLKKKTKKKTGSAELFKAENAFRFKRNAKFASAVWDKPDGL